MMRTISTIFLIGVAALSSACADENDKSKAAVGVAQNAATTKEETITIARSAGGVRDDITVAKNTTGAARETGATRMTVDLMATPYRDAKKAGQLPANTPVEIHERRGGWMKISGNGKAGWAQLYQVLTGKGTQATRSGEGLVMLKSIGKTGRSGSQGIVATTGIRGLSAEDLKTAKPNPKAVESMEASRASDSTARQFARSAGLKEKDVPFLSDNK